MYGGEDDQHHDCRPYTCPTRGLDVLSPPYDDAEWRGEEAGVSRETPHRSTAAMTTGIINGHHDGAQST